LGHLAHLFEDELTNRHADVQDHDQLAQVKNFQLNGGTVPCRLPGAEAGVDGRGGDVDADAQARKAALAFNARRDPGSVREADFLLGETENKRPRVKGVSVGGIDLDALRVVGGLPSLPEH
jgi:hypothetical protein